MLDNQIYRTAVKFREQAENSIKDKEELQKSLSDISHQLKTPLAALSIYNGLLQGAENEEEIQEFVKLSENAFSKVGVLSFSADGKLTASNIF